MPPSHAIPCILRFTYPMNSFLITPVGTSIFGNYLDEGPGGGAERRHYDKIENEPGDRWTDREQRIEQLRQDRTLRDWIQATEEASAEIESIRKIVEQEGEPITVQLLASDTIESRLAAELIRDYAQIDDVEFVFNPDQDQVADLQVFDDNQFADGVRNLVRRLRTLLEDRGELMGRESGGACAINITGGYKATLPYLTVLGELYDVPLHYKFEDADGLLSIPQVPITLDDDLFQEHESEFSALEAGVSDWRAFEEQNHEFASRARNLIEVADNVALLSPLGELFWGYYTDQYVFFYAPDEVYEAIRDGQPNVERILRTKIDQLRRGNQVETKEGHRVFDDGHNSNRIYFFTDEDDLYIYQTFDERGEHDDHEAYYENTSFDESLRRCTLQHACRRRLERTP